MYVGMYMRLCAHPTLHVCLHLVLVTEVTRVEEGQCVGADHISRVIAQDDTHPVHQSRAEQNGATFHDDVNNVHTYVSTLCRNQ